MYAIRRMQGEKMYRIEKITRLSENVYEFVIEAPLVTRNCRPGQFIILRVDENGERVPFTISDFDRDKGTVTVMVQRVGATTAKLFEKEAGDCIQDFVGPLGNPTELLGDNVVLVGGGIGNAVIRPQAKQLSSKDVRLTVIEGARNESLLLYEDEFSKYADRFFIMTDDGSKGEKGFVTDKLRSLIESDEKIDTVFAVGPMPMMRAVAEVTRPYGIKTIVSMNSLMVDGTGMCGCCRVKVDGVTRYACADGPEFDGHLIDFAEASLRLKEYKEQEEHYCRLRGRQ